MQSALQRVVADHAPGTFELRDAVREIASEVAIPDFDALRFVCARFVPDREVELELVYPDLEDPWFEAFDCEAPVELGEPVAVTRTRSRMIAMGVAAAVVCVVAAVAL